MRRVLGSVVLLLALVAVSGVQAAGDSGATLDVDKVRSLVQPSIVYEQTTYSAPVKDANPKDNLGVLFDGEPISAAFRCTGFFVAPQGWVATAGHCVTVGDDNRTAIIEAAGERAFKEGFFTKGSTLEGAIQYADDYFRVAGTVKMSYLVDYPKTSGVISGDQAVNARRVGFRTFEEGDIGLLKFETNGIAMPGLELANGEEITIGTPIVAIGFPGSVDQVTDIDSTPSFDDGKITSIKTTGGGQVRVYQHDAAVSGGMSGGPVVDADGRVVGVTSFGITGETEAFNYATPVEVLREVLGDKSVDNQIGDVGTTYREGVEAFYDGNRSKALARFDDVLKHPGNPAAVLAASMRDRAEKLPKSSGFPIWAIIVIAGGALGLASGTVLLVRRRKAEPVESSPAKPSPGGGGPLAPTPDVRRPDVPRVADAATTKGSGDPTAPALVVLKADGGAGQRHSLSGEMVIGREGTDILIGDEQVSRRHALVRVSDGQIEISDLRSQNGTEVNGKLITSTVRLRHGDTITVGRTSLKVELPRTTRAVFDGPTVIRDPNNN